MLDITTEQSKTFNKTQFMSFSIGKHRVRLLSSPRRVFTHYLKGKGTIECLGSECPICQRNKIIAASTDAPERVPGYNRASLRYYFNVLDRTPVKVCRNCQTENKAGAVDFSPTCSGCDGLITDVEPTPSNKVKVINISKTNAEVLKSIQASNLDEKKEPVGLENYDVTFKVMMVSNRKNILPPEEDLSANDKVEVPEDALYDLDKVVIHLDPDEIEDLLNGVSLKDIFAARKDSFDEDVEDLSDEVSEIVNAAAEELFSN